MTSSSGQTFQITGTSVGGKVVTTKLSVPANSKIVTVNVPTSQGGMAALRACAGKPSDALVKLVSRLLTEPRHATPRAAPPLPGGQHK